MARQQFRWMTFIAIFVLSAVYFFVFSESGVLERAVLTEEKGKIIEKIEALKSEKIRLQERVENYRKGEYPKDELLKSGYIQQDGKIFFFRGIKDDKNAVKTDAKAEQVSVPSLKHLRLIWIGFSISVIIVLVVFGRKMNKSDEQDG